MGFTQFARKLVIFVFDSFRYGMYGRHFGAVCGIQTKSVFFIASQLLGYLLPLSVCGSVALLLLPVAAAVAARVSFWLELKVKC